MQNKFKFSKFLLIFIIASSVFAFILLIDSGFNNNKIFNNAALYTDDFFSNLFGSFSYLILIIIIVSAGILIMPGNILGKVSIITGFMLLTLLFQSFIEAYNFLNLSGGIIGQKLSKIFIDLGNAGNYFFYFFWFFSSIFLLFFPARSNISSFVLFLLKSGIKTDSSNKKIYKSTKRRYPWFSKIVFDDCRKKIEIPAITENFKQKRKFLLVNSNERQVEYEEVDTFSGKLLEDDTGNNDYYERIKNNWPQGWKENEDYEQMLLNGRTDEIRQIEYLDDDIYKDDLVINETQDYENKDYYNNDLTDIGEIEDNAFKGHEKTENKIRDNKTLFPEKNILNNGETINPISFQTEQKESAIILEETLNEFGIKAVVKNIIHGPVVTLFKIVPAPGIRLQKIESLSNNLALRLAAKSIRIIAPIPGEKVVGIEIPNKKRILVNFKEIVNSNEFNESNHNIPIGLGKDIHGNMIIIDLYKMPHILIAGTTGSGKSVCVNSIISSILFSKKPDELRLILIDPKIVELKPYNNIPHLLSPVVTDPKEAIKTLKYLIVEMEKRYSLFDEIGARDIVEYQNKKKKKLYMNQEDLPFIVAIVDEFADLMSIAGKEAEILFARIAAKARAVGIHLVLATQRPSIDVITGLIKANIPARVAFQVISLQDSRIILDQKGAEKLLGQGDMLYLSPTQPYPVRIQGAYLSKDEVDLIAEHWKSIAAPVYININDILNEEEENKGYFDEEDSGIDPLFQQALDIVYETGKASASYLQRRLGIGYNRSARMVEEMEKMGIVGPQRGAKPREIISSKPEI